jgi:hypothetical protein
MDFVAGVTIPGPAVLLMKAVGENNPVSAFIGPDPTEALFNRLAAGDPVKSTDATAVSCKAYNLALPWGQAGNPH